MYAISFYIFLRLFASIYKSSNSTYSNIQKKASANQHAWDVSGPELTRESTRWLQSSKFGHTLVPHAPFYSWLHISVSPSKTTIHTSLHESHRSFHRPLTLFAPDFKSLLLPTSLHVYQVPPNHSSCYVK